MIPGIIRSMREMGGRGVHRIDYSGTLKEYLACFRTEGSFLGNPFEEQLMFIISEPSIIFVWFKIVILWR
jgi:hypothetical protein